MSSRRRLAAAAIAGAVVVSPILTGCGDGSHPQVLLATQFVEGVNAQVGPIQLRNVFILGPAPGTTLPAGGSAPLYATIDNDSATPDHLVTVDSNGMAQHTVIARGVLDLPANQLARTFVSTGYRSVSDLIFKGLTAPLNGTETQRLTFEFANAGNITIKVPVVPWQQWYATFAPVPTAVATPTATNSAARRAKARATPTTSRSGKASPSPSASS